MDVKSHMPNAGSLLRSPEYKKALKADLTKNMDAVTASKDSGGSELGIVQRHQWSPCRPLSNSWCFNSRPHHIESIGARCHRSLENHVLCSAFRTCRTSWRSSRRLPTSWNPTLRTKHSRKQRPKRLQRLKLLPGQCSDKSATTPKGELAVCLCCCDGNRWGHHIFFES